MVVMDSWIFFGVFIASMLLYLHIVAQYKKSEKLEIYEMEYKNNVHLQELCNVNIPIVFSGVSLKALDGMMKSPEAMEGDKTITDANQRCTFDLFQQPNFPLQIRKKSDYYNEENEVVLKVPLPLHSARQLLHVDAEKNYFTEYNQFFIQETDLEPTLKKLDVYLQPQFTLYKRYDIMTGSNMVSLPMRSHTYTRKYIVVAKGNIKVKMTYWKSWKYLYKSHDPTECRAMVDVWDTQPQYKDDIERIKFLEFDVFTNHILYVPPYWWYSIQYQDSDTQLIEYNYGTAMNRFAHIQEYLTIMARTKNVGDIEQ